MIHHPFANLFFVPDPQTDHFGDLRLQNTVKYPSRDFAGHHKKQVIAMTGVRKAPPVTVRIIARKSTTKTPSRYTDGVDLPEPEKETVEVDDDTEGGAVMDPVSLQKQFGYASSQEDLGYVSP